MGSNKKSEVPTAGKRRFLIELENYIKDYIITESNDDLLLNNYMQLVLEANRLGVDIFSGGLLDRPQLFYRYVRPFILAGFKELGAIEEAKPK